MRLLEQINRGVLRELNQAGRATSPEMIAGAKALKKQIRKTLDKKGVRIQGPVQAGATHSLGTIASRPGDPPAKQTGALQKSVVSGAVGGAQAVGLTQFYAPLLEFGVDTRADGATPRSRKNLFTGVARQVLESSRKALSRKARRRDGGAAKTRHTKIEPRPFMDRSIDAAKDQMVDVTVGTIRRRLSDTL